MNKLKICLIIILGMTLFFQPPLKAEDAYLSPYVKVISNPVKQYVRRTLEGGVNYSQRNLSTLFRGDIAGDVWLDQTVSVLSTGEATAVKVVAWQKTRNDGWGSASLRDSIKDFEAKNPGWIVIGGVNGEFSDISSLQTYQAANTFVSNGDVLRKDLCADPNMGVVGFNYGKDSFFGRPQAADNIYLKIYQDGKYDNDAISESLMISSINLPVATGVTLILPDGGVNINVTGYKIYVGEFIDFKTTSDVSFPTTNPILGSFIKGQITEIRENVGAISQTEEGKFYLLSKDGSLDGKLAIGTTLKCEYNLLGQFANVQNTIGYSHQVLVNSNPQFQGKHPDPFVSGNHPRTMLGLKADGSAVMMLVDGRGPGGAQRTGITLFEGAELLRLYDCVQGFNLDGGGSSTMIIRNDEGQLEVVNTPSDGVERKVGNSLLFAIQDPHLEFASITDSSIVIRKTAPLAKGTIQNISVKVDGTVYPMSDDELVIENLTKGTDYNISFTYDIEMNGSTYTGESQRYVVTTDSLMTPVISEFKVLSSTGNTATIRYHIEDDDERILQSYIEFNGIRQTIDPATSSTVISDLPYGQETSFRLILEYGDDKTVQSGTVTLMLEAPEKKGCQLFHRSGALLLLTMMLASSCYLIFRKK